MYNYGNKLTKIREDRHLTLSEVASQLGLPFETYRGIECFNELAYEDIVTIIKILKFYNVTSYYLFEKIDYDENVYISVDHFIAEIQEYIRQKGISIKDFEELAGWGLADMFKDSEFLLHQGILFLRDVCRPLRMNWFHVLRGIEMKYGNVDLHELPNY